MGRHEGWAEGWGDSERDEHRGNGSLRWVAALGGEEGLPRGDDGGYRRAVIRHRPEDYPGGISREPFTQFLDECYLLGRAFGWSPRDVEQLTPAEVAYFMRKLFTDGLVQ